MPSKIKGGKKTSKPTVIETDKICLGFGFGAKQITAKYAGKLKPSFAKRETQSGKSLKQDSATSLKY